MSSTTELRPLLNVGDVAMVLRLSKAVVRERAKNGELPAFRLHERST